jgi:hypothetical protein
MTTSRKTQTGTRCAASLRNDTPSEKPVT